MNRRHLTFWLMTMAVFAALLWLLHEILLPFVGGIALAYVQAPLADRMERLGMNRTIAALLIVSILVLSLIAAVVLIVPLLLHQGSALISNIPGYFKRVQEIIVDPEFPLAELARHRRQQYRIGNRQQGGDLAARLCLFALVRRNGIGLVCVCSDRDARRHLLPDLRLAQDDRRRRRLGAAASARNRAPACA